MRRKLTHLQKLLKEMTGRTPRPKTIHELIGKQNGKKLHTK